MADYETYPEESPAPHLATGFFVLALTLVVTVLVALEFTGRWATAAVATGGVLISLAVFWFMIAQPTIVSLGAARSRHEAIIARSTGLEADVQQFAAERERSDHKVQRLGGILSATQHELNREITMLGFAVDDVVDGFEDGDVSAETMDQLKIALDHVEEGQRNVAALSRLGTNDRTERATAFTASDIAPLTLDAAIAVERNNVIHGDVDLWRLFTKNAVRNAEAHGKANVVTISSGDGRLTIVDDGHGCLTSDLERAWKSGLRPNGTKSDGTQIMRRIADAHDAFVTFQGEEGKGVRIIVDLRDLEIDLRERGAIPAEVSTPHKASGGRVPTNH